MRLRAGAYGAGWEDDEGVGNLRSKSFVNLIEIVGGLSLSDGRFFCARPRCLGDRGSGPAMTARAGACR